MVGKSHDIFSLVLLGFHSHLSLLYISSSTLIYLHRDGKPALSILYYSKDDASKFAFLAKMNAERAAKKKGKLNGFTSQKADHSLLELEGMVNYCTMPMCKRKYGKFDFELRRDHFNR